MVLARPNSIPWVRRPGAKLVITREILVRCENQQTLRPAFDCFGVGLRPSFLADDPHGTVLAESQLRP
jgi:hypothetical protein